MILENTLLILYYLFTQIYHIDRKNEFHDHNEEDHMNPLDIKNLSTNMFLYFLLLIGK